MNKTWWQPLLKNAEKYFAANYDSFSRVDDTIERTGIAIQYYQIKKGEEGFDLVCIMQYDELIVTFYRKIGGFSNSEFGL